jgi:apolipoprotein N-acyltransferase
MNSRISWFFLITLSGVLLSLSWFPNGFAGLLFIAFVPLLLAEDADSNKTGRYAYFTFLVWNILTTWWVCYASLAGGIAAMIFNALFMTLVFNLFRYTKKRLGPVRGYLALPVYWIAFEYLHLNWDLTWPWLTLGNGFASNVPWVQWYEYTGTLGGSLWIWIVNLLLFFAVREYLHVSRIAGKALAFGLSAMALIALPMIFSYVRYASYEEKKDPVNVVVVQPNIDPYTEKFAGPVEMQLQRLLTLAAQRADSNTRFLVGPETALPEGIWEDDIASYPSVKTLQQFTARYPGMQAVVGISSYKRYDTSVEAPATARLSEDGSIRYDAFNTAMQTDKSGNIQLYHKSKLVPGVELLPYPEVFRFIENFAIDLGGTTGTLGRQKERTAFVAHDGMKTGTAICYESIYGEFVSGFVRNGARLLFIITNDGWWEDTPGYRQHLNYARLRAIECRRSIARSANTGVSCFIDQKGDMHQNTPWWKPAVIGGDMNASDALTFYVRNGDYIGRAASLSVMLFAGLHLLQLIACMRKKTT